MHSSASQKHIRYDRKYANLHDLGPLERNPTRAKEKFILAGLLFSFQWDSFYWDFVLVGLTFTSASTLLAVWRHTFSSFRFVPTRLYLYSGLAVYQKH